MSRGRELSDVQWAVIEPFMLRVAGRSRPFRDHRQVIEGIVHRYRCGLAWCDLPNRFGPWQTVWKRHQRFCVDGTWDKILTAVLANADAMGDIDWVVSIDSTINRAHQHAATLTRLPGGHGRITRITRIPGPGQLTSLLITRSDVPAAACPRRSTTRSMAEAGRW